MSEFSIGHLADLDSPWGNAGGVVKTIADVKAMAKTGVGWIEAGSYTLDRRLGNAVDPKHPARGPQKKVYHYDPETEMTDNAEGMPNQGEGRLEDEIPEMNEIARASGKEVVYNLAPVSDDPEKECQVLVARAIMAGAKFVLLNAGCPNITTKDGRRYERLSHNPEMLGRVLVGLSIVLPRDLKIFLRLSPYPTKDEMAAALDPVVSSRNVSAIFTPNAWAGMSLDRAGNKTLEVLDEIGGRSGPGMFKKAREQLEWAVDIVDGSGIDVVSSGSIKDAKEFKKRRDMGAVAGCSTTFYRQPRESWQKDTERLLLEYEELEAA